MTKTELKKKAEECYQNLQFKDDFLFCKILVNRPDIAKELLEMILDTRIEKVVPQNQKVIEITADGRGVRLDVYLDDEYGTVYDLEMQTTKRKDLPKRTRYYQGMIDLNLISRGAKFSELNKSYVIFICTEDPFSEGRHIYRFENICKEDTSVKLGDEAYKVLLNASGTQQDVSENLMDFLEFIRTGKGKTDLCKRLECEVEMARMHEEWRIEYMTLFMRDEEMREQGREQGIEQGIEAFILDKVEDEVSKEQTVKKLMKRFGLSQEDAEMYYEKYTLQISSVSAKA